MRRIFILMLLPMLAVPSWAAKRMTVAQFEQMLGTERAEHKSDSEIARKIGEIELSERLTDLTLDRMSKQFAAASLPETALSLLADRSAFLNPPADELPSTPAPDATTQGQLLETGRRFAVEILPRLPDLLATRTTFSFDDGPQEVTKGGYPERLGLHFIGSSKVEVSVRNDTRADFPSFVRGGLMTWGEFGSALRIILSDSAHGTTMWSHWERTPAGVVAVFNYAVPKTASHYEIDTPTEQFRYNDGSNRWARADGFATTTLSSKPLMVHSKPAYQGSLWIDPATGIIRRVTLVADLRGNSTIERGAILVEYSPISIAGKTLICPVRSLALSSAPANVSATLKGVASEWLNENLFTDYHLFGSTSRILDEKQTALVPSVAPAATNAQTEQTSPAFEPAPHEEFAPASPAPQQMAVAPAKVPSDAPASAPVANEQTPPPKQTDALTGEPSERGKAVASAAASITTNREQPSPIASANIDDQTSGTPRIQLTVNRVLVPVVVRDRQGRAVGDLKEGDFQVLDDGKSRPISAFVVERRGPIGGLPANSSQSDHQPPPPGNAATQLSIAPERIAVLLFDDLHMSYEEVALSTKAASQALEETLSGSELAAVVSISGKVNSGLTSDRTKLTGALMALRPLELSHPDSSECPKISYYQADLIINQHRSDALQDAEHQVTFICNPKAPLSVAEFITESTARNVLAVGQHDVLATYNAIREYVRVMAKLPGQRTLILVSPGFLPLEEEARTEESRVLDLAAQSNVAISALDARGLYTGSSMASDDLRGRAPEEVSDYKQTSMMLAGMAMGTLADGTGGIYFQNSNDLVAGFKALTGAPETIYLLELSLDSVKANGTYHRLEVKIDRSEMKVQARRGYFMPKLMKRKE